MTKNRIFIIVVIILGFLFLRGCVCNHSEPESDDYRSTKDLLEKREVINTELQKRVDAQDKIIKQLQTENKDLKKKLGK